MFLLLLLSADGRHTRKRPRVVRLILFFQFSFFFFFAYLLSCASKRAMFSITVNTGRANNSVRAFRLEKKKKDILIHSYMFSDLPYFQHQGALSQAVEMLFDRSPRRSKVQKEFLDIQIVGPKKKKMIKKKENSYNKILFLSVFCFALTNSIAIYYRSQEEGTSSS